MERQKRAVAIHDISGFGKCSLTVALPIISATGVETTVMPTAVLSTHTGGFTGFTYRDLTDDMRGISGHWQSLGLKFDAIYSGFLGSAQQIDIVSDFIDMFKTENTVVLVDPAMADNGKMYPLFNMTFAWEMLRLCSKADIIVPNFTEAAFMLGEEYVDGPYTPEYVEGIIKRVSERTDADVVLTGVCFDKEKLGSATYERKTGNISYSFADRIEGYYHGTGDVFASALLGAYLNGKDLAGSARIAVDFTQGAIIRTRNAGTDVRFGVDFERGLPELIKKIQLD